MAAIDLEHIALRLRKWIDREHAGDHVQRVPSQLASVLVQSIPDELLAMQPDSRIFGRAVITAAAAKRVTGCCRFGDATNLALAQGLPEPRITMATQILLGRPCDRCYQRSQDEVDWQRARPERARAAKLAVVASAMQSALHPRWTCVTCEQYLVRARRAVVAGAVPQTLQPHKRVLATTGWAKPIPPAPHNGMDSRRDCSCAECRGARVMAYERSAARMRTRSAPARSAAVPASPTDRDALRGPRRTVTR